MTTPTNDDIRIDITTFRDWEPDSLHDLIAELNSIGESTSPKIRFLLSDIRPDLQHLDVSEWLDHTQIVSLLSSHIKPVHPLILLTKHRLNLDYFGDTFPKDNISVITTYNNYVLPRDVLEKQYLLYSVTYCALDLIINPNLWHADPRGCIFDQVLVPSEIADGLLSSFICEPCRSALSKCTNRFAVAIVGFVDKLLASLDGKVARASRKKQPKGKRRTNGSTSTNLGSAKGGFLVVDRAAMRRALSNRFGIDVPDTFADDPEEIRRILGEVTTQMGRLDLTRTQVEELVRLNHTTDIFYLDVDKRHRDHSMHQLYVALFGLELLDVRIPHVSTHPKVKLQYTSFRDFLAAQLKIPTERADWTWYTTAILHDHAYPLSALLSRVARYLRVGRHMSLREMMGKRLATDVDLYRNLLAPPFAKIVDRALSSAAGSPNADEFEEQYVNAIRNALATSVGIREVERRMPRSRYDHGVIGAANLAMWAGQDRSIDVEYACSAIFEHNLENEIILESQPLSFLLKLCDTLQEWDRIVYPSGGPPLRESERIEIGPFYKRKGLQVEEPLKVRFTFNRKDVLDQSGWDSERFRVGTRRHLKLLKNNNRAFMQLDEMDVNYVQSLSEL